MAPLDHILDDWFNAGFRAPVAAALATYTHAHASHRDHPSNHTGHIVGIVLASIFMGVVVLTTLRALCSREECRGRRPDSDSDSNDDDNDNYNYNDGVHPHGHASSSDVEVVTPALAHVPLHEDVVLPGAGVPGDVEEAGAAAAGRHPRRLRVGTFRVPFTRPGIVRSHRNAADARGDGWKTPPPPYELPPSYESPPGYEMLVEQPRACVLAGRGGAGLGR